MVSGERHHAEALREQVTEVLAPLGLRLSPEKTHVVHVEDEGFDFLGFHIHRRRKRGTNKYYVYTTPSKKAVQAIKDKVSTKTYRHTLNNSLDEVLVSLHRLLRGWANYFRHGVSKAAFDKIDEHAWHRLVGWIYRKHNRLSWKQLKRRFCLPGSWTIAHNGVVFTGAASVAVTRYRYRGSTIPTPMDTEPGDRHQQLTSGQDTWSARCVETRTSGAAGGSGKRTGSNPDTAPGPDPADRAGQRVSRVMAKGIRAGRDEVRRRSPHGPCVRGAAALSARPSIQEKCARTRPHGKITGWVPHHVDRDHQMEGGRR